MNTSWDWEKIDNQYWEKPAEEIYYYLKRWNMLGFSNILDLGCGMGRHTYLFAQHGFKVTAIDSSEYAIKSINENNKSSPGIESFLGNIFKMDFGENAFDAIIAYNAIYHSETSSVFNIMRKMRKSLRKNGELFVTFLSKNDESFSNAKDKIDDNTRLKAEEDGTVLPHFYISHNELPRIFEGYRIISLKEIVEYFENVEHRHFNVHAMVIK